MTPLLTPPIARRGQLGAMNWGYVSPSFRALGHRFGVRTTDLALGRHLFELLAAFEDGGEVSTWYSVLDRGQGVRKQWVAYVNDTRVAFTDDASAALAYVFWHINFATVKATDDLVMLHAAAAELRGHAVILPAPMESGKTTLVAGLVRAGMRYLTDEIVAFEEGTLTIRAYPKPLSIDPGSWAVLADIQPRLDADLTRYHTEQWQVSAGSIHSDAVAQQARPRFVVAPRYDPTGPTAIEPMSRRSTLMALMANRFRPDDRTAWQLEILAEVTRSCDGYRLAVSDLDLACRLVLDLFGTV